MSAAPSSPETTAPAEGRSPVRLGLVAVLAVGAAVAGLVVRDRLATRHEREARHAEVEAGSYVRVMTLAPGGVGGGASVQGEALPYAQTILYAKVSGYLREVHADKGDRVRAGQVLAVIQSPEVESDFQSLKADAENKRANAKRMEALAKDALVSARELEQAQTDARVAEAKLASQGVLRGYQVLKAPFDGTVTARYADPGALVQNASTGSSGALPIVTVAKVDRLRVTFYVDQHLAARTRPGVAVRISPSDRPDLDLPAKVTRVSGQLDARTRMMLVEADLDNREGLVVPGGFVQVSLELKGAAGLAVPSDALLLRGGKPFVGVVGADERVHIRPVVLGEDQGQLVQVVSGLQAGERIALNLGVGAAEGDRIRAVEGK